MKRENGYFTVEAALVFPLALGTVLFIVYMMLFLYDRCLMEQELGAAAMWGSQVRADSGEELERLIKKRLDGIYWDKYVVWKMEELDVRLSGKRFSAKGKGRLVFPVPDFSFWGGDSVWRAEADFTFPRISPEDFVRACNRVRFRSEESVPDEPSEPEER